jgi:hypothetical protein
MTFPYVLTDKTMTVVIDGIPHHVERTHPSWDNIKLAISDEATTSEQMLALMDLGHAVEEATVEFGQVQLLGGHLTFNGQQVHSVLAERILDVIREGLDVLPWVKFAENVYANPAAFSRDELYLFLEKSDLPMTTDGCFLAYKNVGPNYLDIHSRTFDNSVGQIVEMPREHVDPDRNNTCSRGLHFCSKGYLSFYSNHHDGHTMIVKINPKDVVSIPSDYDNAKGRTWRYEVVGEIPRPKAETVVWPSVVDDEDTPWDDEDWDAWGDDDDYPDDEYGEVTAVDTDSDVVATPAPAGRFARWFRK